MKPSSTISPKRCRFPRRTRPKSPNDSPAVAPATVCFGRSPFRQTLDVFLRKCSAHARSRHEKMPISLLSRRLAVHLYLPNSHNFSENRLQTPAVIHRMNSIMQNHLFAGNCWVLSTIVRYFKLLRAGYQDASGKDTTGLQNNIFSPTAFFNKFFIDMKTAFLYPHDKFSCFPRGAWRVVR